MPLDTESARLLFQVVSSCYESRSMIFTTNIEFSKWGTVLGDDKLASAMIDRIVHHGRLVEFNGASHRMDAALMLGRAKKTVKDVSAKVLKCNVPLWDCGGNPGPNRNRKEAACTALSRERSR